MNRELYNFHGGIIVLPASPLIDRHDGGNLIINPPRTVWERSELSAEELTNWSFLVAATGRAMLDVLPQLKGGCINYWEAGNWALNELAEPIGPKRAKEHRKVHMHLLGRSRFTTNEAVRWGEAPKFPDYVDSKSWTGKNEPLNTEECHAVVEVTKQLLKQKYNLRG